LRTAQGAVQPMPRQSPFCSRARPAHSSASIPQGLTTGVARGLLDSCRVGSSSFDSIGHANLVRARPLWAATPRACPFAIRKICQNPARRRPHTKAPAWTHSPSARMGGCSGRRAAAGRCPGLLPYGGGSGTSFFGGVKEGPNALFALGALALFGNWANTRRNAGRLTGAAP
jgi:hypothetical protein